MLYFLVAIAAIAGLLFGYDEGIIGVARPLLVKDYPLSQFVDGFMSAAVPLGALAGAIIAGRLTERFGRRRVLMGAAALFAIGALAAAAIGAIWQLVLARLVLGLAIGVAAVTAPLYIAETAPLSIRGALVSTYQLAITFGIVASYLMGIAITGDGTWRSMFGLGCVPGLLFLLGLIFLPESPRWLMMHRGRTEAAASLRRLRKAGAAIEAELDEIEAAVRSSAKASTHVSDLMTPYVKPALIVGMGLFFLQQLSGINAVIYYAPVIFEHAGFGNAQTQVLATIGIGMVNFLTTILAMLLIDRWGRRPLLVFGFLGTAISLLLIAVAVLVPGLLPEWMVIVCLAAYIASFAISLGPLPFVVMSEIFPLRVRGIGMGMASVSNWGFNFVVVFAFPLLLESIGLAGTFILFAVVCLAGVAFTLVRVPETNGISLEQIEAHLQTSRPLVELSARPRGETV
ncbi:sugar porter family MFS transporter [Acidocella aminolytica]|uniref:Major facilitator superfamily sugar transporter n=1 Tax=Acidocella aminolytica 101 = DSM 11237 TaxID=1120923 RepID=A0A0D6PIW4_9PROT|nr:sugar porter family MFS transporter [Acidocella aminolytica]GAN81326.1 major facilitator superfamily sugar transporter [Acidocella aminolytica 101 = DSM 11237]GBQ42065.1 major facilitator superfamily transporter [Acidocella aminolytica 101 = DSM 11237]SHF49883.1 MFS transporter, sugar porter (SP) family [Acidocella aminolytica 101 = DSM 11237]